MYGAHKPPGKAISSAEPPHTCSAEAMPPALAQRGASGRSS